MLTDDAVMLDDRTGVDDRVCTDECRVIDDATNRMRLQLLDDDQAMMVILAAGA